MKYCSCGERIPSPRKICDRCQHNKRSEYNRDYYRKQHPNHRVNGKQVFTIYHEREVWETDKKNLRLWIEMGHVTQKDTIVCRRRYYRAVDGDIVPAPKRLMDY